MFLEIEKDKFTDEQYNCISFAKNTNKNFAVLATAGAGKTYTLVNSLQEIRFKNALFLAYNKSIVNEISTKIKNNKVKINTIHSFAYSILKSITNKNYNIKQDYFEKALSFLQLNNDLLKDKDKSMYYYAYVLSKSYDIYRMTYSSLDKVELRENLERYGIIFEISLFDMFFKFLQFIKKNTNDIDFTDMLYLSVTNKSLEKKKILNNINYDLIIIDEVQDLSKLDILFIKMLVKINTRIIIAGDDKQAIYKFKGANPNSFNEFCESFEIKDIFEINTSQRCSKNVCFEASKIGKIEYKEDAIEGEVETLSFLEEVNQGDFVLSRNNINLVKAYFDIIEEDKSAYIVGKDIEKKVNFYLEKYSKYNLNTLLTKLEDELSQKEQELIEKGFENFKRHYQYVELYETIQVINIIASKVENIKELHEKITEIFLEKENSVILMTIHKSKGLEASNVYLIAPKNVYSKFSVTEEDKKVDNNLMFVAITRAKENFYYVENYY